MAASNCLSRFCFHFLQYGSSLLHIKTDIIATKITNQPYFSKNSTTACKNITVVKLSLL